MSSTHHTRTPSGDALLAALQGRRVITSQAFQDEATIPIDAQTQTAAGRIRMSFAQGSTEYQLLTDVSLAKSSVYTVGNRELNQVRLSIDTASCSDNDRTLVRRFLNELSAYSTQ
ncbi:uncharacterized protein I303_108268 [Kwoniella dejecticola CBS 10117]|uniref:Uncharacterized protein n=1 Tax=Kwoniella dejecticola CBS 10117 TaxID=1296121 RepID=A0A1A5ZXX7_9TREE|nr:uncharacterized protein I303_07405 [Kwoniella dejecticola CBS 10117]OBR82643.1 hypothetical protein I303_07405 [Kwoniella dejecticola CBS 10117]